MASARLESSRDQVAPRVVQAHSTGKYPRSPAWLILTVLAGTMLGFGASIFYSESSADQLDEDAVSIATDASPAIEYLTAARGEIWHIQLEAGAVLQRSDEAMPPDPSMIDGALSRLHGELSAYLGLPFYPGEREQYSAVEKAMRAFEAEVATFLARVQAGDTAGARSCLRGGLSSASAELDDALERLTFFDADEQRRLGIEIPRLRSRANRIGYVLESITAVFGTSLMLLVVRATRRYSQLLDERRHAAEEQAIAAVAFSSRLESLANATVSIADTITANEDLQRILAAVAGEVRSVARADYCALGLDAPPEHPTDMGPCLRIPLVHHNRNVGSLYLARAKGQAAFTEDDERAAGLLAAFVAVAVDNALLYKQAQAATRAREDLLATVSHDLKNPLNAIRMSTDLLHRSVQEGRAADLAARIERAANRMLQMIGDLLDAAKIEAGRLRAAGQPESVTSLVEEAVGIFTIVAAEKSIELAPDVVCSSTDVVCERELLLRVFSNIIGNAIKFTPRGGVVSIRAEMREAQVHFSIKDTGPGIAADQLPHVFDRYWQQRDSDRRGSGLGLYIAKGIVEAHGGRIWVESILGEGATFHFTVPLSLA